MLFDKYFFMKSLSLTEQNIAQNKMNQSKIANMPV